MKLPRIAAIYASLAATKIDSIFRAAASWAEIDAWIAAKKFDSPAAVGLALVADFRYRPDGLGDYALSPRCFFKERADDCDGFAMFAEYVLGKLGYADVSRIYIRSSSDRAHVICVCRSNGKLWQVGNWHPFALRGESLQEIGQEISERMQGNLSYAVRFKGNSYQEYVEK